MCAASKAGAACIQVQVVKKTDRGNLLVPAVCFGCRARLGSSSLERGKRKLSRRERVLFDRRPCQEGTATLELSQRRNLRSSKDPMRQVRTEHLPLSWCKRLGPRDTYCSTIHDCNMVV